MHALFHGTCRLHQRRYLLFFLFFLASFGIAPQARALSISPLRQTVVVAPGDETMVYLRVENDTDHALTFTPAVDPFSIDSQTGRAVFGARDEAALWFRFSVSPRNLSPRASIDVPFSIAVPEGASPGSHYFGLFAAEAPEQGSVGIRSRVGSLLYVHVAGEVEEGVTREVFSSDSAWYTALPISLTVWLKNNGTIHVIPEGTISLHTRSGRILRTESLNAERRTILPQGRFESVYAISGLRWRDAGPISATLSVEYGLSRQQIVDTISFWYVPRSLLGLFLALGALIVLTIVVIRKRQKKFWEKHTMIT